ncbi:MAG: helix-turn-helix transcriptional regulator [Acidobacteriota bacterium]|jgi:phage repressor protein C with HTH and peptisase S24 domain
MNYGERIRVVRESLGLSQAEVARRLGWSPPNFARIEKGRITPSLKSLEAIAQALDVRVSVLADNLSIPAEIPVVAFVSAGPGVEFTDQGYPAGGGMYFVERPPSFTDPHGFAVEVSGDSMTPKYEKGQVVLVDTRKRPVSGDYAVVGLTNGEKYIKRYREAGGMVVLESVNTLYDPVVVPPEEVRFAYKVVWSKER